MPGRGKGKIFLSEVQTTSVQANIIDHHLNGIPKSIMVYPTDLAAGDNFAVTIDGATKSTVTVTVTTEAPDESSYVVRCDA